MKKALFVSLMLLGAMGCKGPAGSKGDTGATGAKGDAGAPGTPGLPNASTYQGTATNDNYAVSVPNLDVSKGDLLSVYACNSSNAICEQVNLYQAGIPANMAYIETPGNVNLVNLITSNLPNYYITVVVRH